MTRKWPSLPRSSPAAPILSVVRWRRSDLAALIEQRFGVVCAGRSLSALLARLGYVRISARPQHPGQDVDQIEAFKKTSLIT